VQLYSKDKKSNRLNKSELHNERELLILISQSDENAYRELFHFYRPAIYASLRMAGNAEWAKDIYQDIFLRVWLKRAKLPSIENFAGWLFIVSRNIMLDTFEETENNQASELYEIENTNFDTIYDPERILQHKEVQVVLAEAVSRLPPKQRETYDLIKVHGLTRLETATRMNISPETVKWNLERAIRSLRAYCLKHLDLTLFVALVIGFL
jgi:RNA polymerase sigma-70 factor (ECF subfamily)